MPHGHHQQGKYLAPYFAARERMKYQTNNAMSAIGRRITREINAM